MRFFIFIVLPFITQCYHDKDYGETGSLSDSLESWWKEPVPAPQAEPPRNAKIIMIKSAPANIYDYYEYDAEKDTWVWSDKTNKDVKMTKPKIKKQPNLSDDKEPVSWVIFARGISKEDIKKRFPDLEKNYELCRYNRKTVKLECTSDAYQGN